MGLFDRLRNVANRLIGRSETSPETSIDSEIAERFGTTQNVTNTGDAKSLFERARSFFGNINARMRRTPSNVDKTLKDARIALGRISKSEERRYEIFKFRRTSEREESGRAFYRLTQGIWDRLGISIEQRDEAIKQYFFEKYGISDLNDIYDKVLSENAEKLEEYVNAPNAVKYKVLKNVSIDSYKVEAAI